MSESRYILDTSAVLTFLEDEDGAERVETVSHRPAQSSLLLHKGKWQFSYTKTLSLKHWEKFVKQEVLPYKTWLIASSLPLKKGSYCCTY